MSYNSYRVKDNKLIIEDEILEFDFPIDYFIEISGMLIILLAIPVSVKYNENVLGVSLSEKMIKWQIEKRRFKLQPFTKLHCEYYSISFYEGKLRLNNWCDAYLIVDPFTGDVLEEGATR